MDIELKGIGQLPAGSRLQYPSIESLCWIAPDIVLPK